MVRRALIASLLGMTTLVVSAHLWVGAAGPIVTELEAVPSRGVVIVPGARVDADGRPSWMLARRLDSALALYRAGKVLKVLVSGDHGAAAYDETNAMRRYLVERGVPARDVFMDHAGFRTRDTMERAVRVFGVRDAVICTQGLYAARTAFLAKQAGIDAVVLVSDGDRWLSLGASLRERAATVVAAFDVVVGTEPRFVGPAIDIAGDGTVTQDRQPVP